MVLFYSFLARGQTVKIIGNVQDTNRNLKLSNASVVVIKSTDSIIFADTRTHIGKFIFKKVPNGQYFLIVSYPKYVDFLMPLSLGKDSVLDLGNINLVSEAIFLATVTVTAKRIPIKIRGDTTEYDPLAYNLKVNATAEDLLKQLQNFQVDKYGNITAQGKQINRVLVDGEEFFGNDPTLVTKNLRADMIDKVQVFNKKSDQATFTGINDGKDSKVVNFKLKKGNKVGAFGKAELAFGDHGFYQSQLFYNHFNNDEKFALHAFSNNTGTVGLSRRDRQQYSDGSTDASYNNYDLDIWNGEYTGKGVPTSIGAGSHYSNKFKEGKVSINMNYNFNDLNIKGNDYSSLQENLPNTSFLTNSRRTFDNTQQKNNLNGELRVALDSTSTVSFKVNVGLLHKKTFSDYSSEMLDLSGGVVNSNARLFSTTGDKQAGASDILYLKKLRKQRRTISLGLNLFNTTSNSSGVLGSSTNIISNVGNDGPANFNQFKTNDDRRSSVTLKAVYTEPLSKSSSVSVNVGGLFNSEAIDRKTFDQSMGGADRVFNSLFSNNYRLDQFSLRGGMHYYYSKNNIRLQAGSDFSHVDFDQKNLSTNKVLKRKINNYFPAAEFSYDFSSREGIVLKYNGYSNLPTLEQVQPVINNIDPLNTYIGNEGLAPSFTNSFSLNYIAFKTEKDIFLNGVGSFSIVNDPIITSVNTDSLGVSSYTYVNLKNGRNIRYSASFSVGAPTHISDIIMTIDGSFQGNQFENLVNSRLSRNVLNVSTLVFGVGKSKTNIYSCGISFGLIYNSNYNNLQPLLVNKSWGYTSRPNFDFYLPFKMMIHTEADYLFQEGTSNFPNDFSRFVWNSYIQKDFFKNSSLTAKVSVNDILNQNKGFDRFINQNLVIQNTYDTIKRYFMFSLVYNFKKHQTKK